MPDSPTQCLTKAEDELKALRQRVAQAVAFIHDPAYDRDARIALAQRLGLPEPTPEPR